MTGAQAPLDTPPDAAAAGASWSAANGMRHSIRPRQSVLDRADRRAQPTDRGAAPAASSVLDHAAAPGWDALPLVEPGANRARQTAMPVVDAQRDTATVRAFDLLRTRLRQVTQENGWRNVAITAPTGGCGTTFTAVNLALSLSRVPGSRTVLMDMNLRAPGLADAFDMAPRGAMRDYLDGRVPIGDQIVRASDTLALGLTNAPDPDAAEVLQNARTGQTLHAMRAALRPDLVLYDLPAMLSHDDVTAFLPQLDGVLLVSDGAATVSRQLVACERALDGQVPLLGVVLNRARRDSLPN